MITRAGIFSFVQEAADVLLGGLLEFFRALLEGGELAVGHKTCPYDPLC